MPTEWITTTEAARLLRIGDRAVRQRITRGTLPARRAGGAWLVHLANLVPDSTTQREKAS